MRNRFFLSWGLFVAAIWLAARACTTPALPAPKPADEFYLKVVSVDRQSGRIETELATPPRKEFVTFSGEVGEKVFAGDFVKFEVRNKTWHFAGHEMKVELVRWIF
jgi:hypothetical protein